MNPTRLFCALLLAATTLTASAALADDRPSQYFAQSDPPPAPFPDKKRWPDGDDTVAILDESEAGRWIAQARAGRASAAMKAGNLLKLWARRHGSCQEARKWFEQAEQLGNDNGAAALGLSYVSEDCPDLDPEAAVPWLRKGTDLGHFQAALRLSGILADSRSPHFDATGAYAYARVALAAPDGELESDPPDAEALGAALSAEQRAQGDARAAAILAGIRSREAGFAPQPPEVQLATREATTWSAVSVAVDDLRECERNLIGNCRGVRRLAYAELTNRSDDFLSCNLALDTVHGATGKPLTLRRETLVSPRAVRRLRVGRISGAPGSEAFKVKCSPLADLTARVAAGECAARPAQSIDLAAIYPRESRKREETGRVTLYVIAPTPAGIPIHTEVAYGSAFALLDAAALEATRALPFRSECASGVGFIRFAFEFRLGN